MSSNALIRAFALTSVVLATGAVGAEELNTGAVVLRTESSDRSIVRFDRPEGGFEFGICHGPVSPLQPSSKATCKTLPGTRFKNAGDYARSGLDEAFVRAYLRAGRTARLAYAGSSGALALVTAWGISKTAFSRGPYQMVELNNTWHRVRSFRVTLSPGGLLLAGAAGAGLYYAVRHIVAQNRLDRRLYAEGLNRFVDGDWTVSDDDFDRMLLALDEAIRLTNFHG